MNYAHFDTIVLISWCILAGIVAAINWHILTSRARKMQALARKYGLQYLGGELPPGYPEPPLQPLFGGGPRNVIFGEIDGDPVVAFDLSLANVSARRSTTVVARRWQTRPDKPWMHRELLCHVDGQWRFAYRDYSLFTNPKLMEPEFIEEVWRILQTRPLQAGTSSTRARD